MKTISFELLEDTVTATLDKLGQHTLLLDLTAKKLQTCSKNGSIKQGNHYLVFPYTQVHD